MLTEQDIVISKLLDKELDEIRVRDYDISIYVEIKSMITLHKDC
jgi:hypothetical protein